MSAAPPAPATTRRWRWAAVALTVLLTAAVTRSAWLCDDAFITFRSVENLMQGHGPVWNTGERVQTYTHPLWFWLLAVARAATGECPTTTMVLSLAIATLAAAWLARGAGTAPAAVAVLLLLLASRAWIDYATSGLETPLSAALVVALLAAATGTDPAARVLRVALATAALALTRLDLLALAAPVCLHAARGLPWRRTVRLAALGLSPLFAWLAFATVYYGTPLPVTASAKAFHHGLPTGELWQRGFTYLVHCAAHDPVTVAALAVALVLGLVRSGQRAIALGLALYGLYVVKVGGDYMLGRFLLPPFAAAAWLLGRAAAGAPARAALTAGLAALALAFVPGLPDVLRPLQPATPPDRSIPDHGLVSERDYYFLEHGLFSPVRSALGPGLVSAMLRQTGHPTRIVGTAGAVGVPGYLAGDLVHLVDPWLLDPSLMRLPIADPQLWRIGHYYRSVPEGYYETIASGENRIRDAGFARFHAAMWTVRTAPLWSAERWRAIWSVWTGAFDADLERFVAGEYRHPPRVEVPLARLAADLPPAASPALPGPFWSDVPQAVCVRRGGIAVPLPAPSQARTVRLHVSHADRYTVQFRRADATVGTATLATIGVPTDCLHANDIPVPDGAAPFDALWIDIPMSPNPVAAAIGRIELLP
ncbi:MAG: hypothetical protein JNL08_11610 [Planctomycetes bacterium]|nr:hypothetical protein [Planctomycetota bacterium]